jgi:hypothetical protein
MESIASDPKADQEEKRRMMEMLRRFEDAAAEGDDALAELEEEEGDEDEDDELAAALEGLDLGKSSFRASEALLLVAEECGVLVQILTRIRCARVESAISPVAASAS